MTETSSTGLLSQTQSCALTGYGLTNCWKISYPTDVARISGGSPSPFAYNLVVKYGPLTTTAYTGS